MSFNDSKFTTSSPIINQASKLSSTPVHMSANLSQNLNSSGNMERNCFNVCQNRFKYIILMSATVQFIMLIIYTTLLYIFFLHPVVWAKEIFLIIFALIFITMWSDGYFIFHQPLLEEKEYHSTRFISFMRRFPHELTMLTFNFTIGLMTALLFLRYLSEQDDSYSFINEKKFIFREKHGFLILNAIFLRCYFYYNKENDEQTISFPMIHQSKLLQIKRKLKAALKSSLTKSLIPTLHAVAFYLTVGRFLFFFIRWSDKETSVIKSFLTVMDVKLLFSTYILTSFILNNMKLTLNIVNIVATHPKIFPIDGNESLILAEVLSFSKNQITQLLAAYDLFTLSNEPNSSRRKQFYALSNPGGHPHNWKLLVQKSLVIVNNFSDEVKKTTESISKSKGAQHMIDNKSHTLYNFYESKRMTREYNNFTGIRNMGSNPLMPPPNQKPATPKLIDEIKQKLLNYKIIFFIFGEADEAKLNFLLRNNSQAIEWIVQGISAMVVRSLKEDSYGVVQHDIKQILKSLIKLKTMLDKIGAYNSISRDRNFMALKASVRRSLYQIVNTFSGFFEDLLLDSEDVRALHGFVNYREL
ncbi:CLUMA_CG008489, isoform A [Clunio marinus]|uniref:CLUMA_CG008489, isoform A n=1 Tax=Clunio marinus TaxID=568069 RepID=A0A1J1I483_9DIPT|nr:CLUMA_CG008489, isoform A [Clunio marinus]